jgi:TRAP-type C4-dicarboxylate transport system substrate-binding protein
MADEFKETQVIAFHTHGPGVLHSKDKPMRSAADLRNLKVRGPTRQATKLLGAAGATPVGMPLPQVPDALLKGTIDACALPWEVIPSVRVPELVKHHSEFGPKVQGLYTNTFVMAMNKPRYDSLAPDLKAVIDANAGMAASAWLGRTQQGNDPAGRKSATDRGNTVHTFTAAETQEFIKLSSAVDDEWVADMDKRGFKGRVLLDSAKALIAKHGKG